MKRNTRRGSALILSLWALLLLSAAIFAWVKLIDQDITIAAEANGALDARALAHSGVAVALHPGVTPLTPALENQLSPDRGYKVQLQGEAGKLNLNWLLQGALANPPAPDADERLAMFKRFLERRGLSFKERETLVDSMLDWIDGDNLKRLNGAEDEGDYHPPNRGAFVSVDELQQVKGSRPLVAQPDWKNDLTINTNPGAIDLQWASQAVLEVLPNVGDARAQSFLQVRRGADKLDGTKDDHVFKDLTEALSYLGLAGPAALPVQPFVTLKDPTVRIVSVGQSGKVYRQVEVVARKMGAQPQILWWKE